MNKGTVERSPRWKTTLPRPNLGKCSQKANGWIGRRSRLSVIRRWIVDSSPLNSLRRAIVARLPEAFASLPAVLARPPHQAGSPVSTRYWWAVALVQERLRLAWDAPDLREAEWHIFLARYHFYQSTVVMPLFEERLRTTPAGINPFEQPRPPEEIAADLSAPLLTPFEQAMYHLQRIIGQMRRCPNPECPAPYFLAKKKAQKYCCSKCSASMQRLQKRQWWREHRARKPSGFTQ